MVTQTSLSGTGQPGRSTGARIINDGYMDFGRPRPRGHGRKRPLPATRLSTLQATIWARSKPSCSMSLRDASLTRYSRSVVSLGWVPSSSPSLVVLTLDATEKRFILDVSKEKLENAEGFDKDHWPTMADPRGPRACTRITTSALLAYRVCWGGSAPVPESVAVTGISLDAHTPLLIRARVSHQCHAGLPRIVVGLVLVSKLRCHSTHVGRNVRLHFVGLTTQ